MSWAVYERKFKSEYLERQIYELLIKSEPSIVKRTENKSDLSKLSTLSEPSVVKFVENQSKHLSKLTLYHFKKRATRRSRRASEPSRILLLFLRGLSKKNSMLKKFVFKKISTIEIPKSSKLHRYVNKVRKLYHSRYKCIIIKITISSFVIGLKMSYFPLIRLPSCYRTVC